MRIGNAAFFAPLTVTSPASALPPCTIIVSTDLLNREAPAKCSRNHNAISTAIILIDPSVPVSRIISEQRQHQRAYCSANLDSARAALAQITRRFFNNPAIEIEPVDTAVERSAWLPTAHLSLQVHNFAAGNIGRIGYNQIKLFFELLVERGKEIRSEEHTSELQSPYV